MSKDKLSASGFVKQLSAGKSDDLRAKVERHYKGPAKGNKCLGVRMGSIFELAKSFIDLPLDQIEKLLDSTYYEVRMGGVSVMDFQARRKSTPEERRQELFDLYIRRHDRINNWDLVDRAAPHVVGGYLHDRPRGVLYKLAESDNEWERRTAIVSTYYFIRLGDLADTFKVAALLVGDENEYVRKAVGSWLREAGKKDEKRLKAFLNEHAPKMAADMLRSAIEKLSSSAKARYKAKMKK
jgi:3-methyladenine DNA glycosylase AlkD